ncbi:hypothetical protein GW17_00055702 [Ensete ventricosum]|nr:hypothetical protein GW17_00055702 [Ensete ventricosum]
MSPMVLASQANRVLRRQNPQQSLKITNTASQDQYGAAPTVARPTKRSPRNQPRQRSVQDHTIGPALGTPSLIIQVMGGKQGRAVVPPQFYTSVPSEGSSISSGTFSTECSSALAGAKGSTTRKPLRDLGVYSRKASSFCQSIYAKTVLSMELLNSIHCLRDFSWHQKKGFGSL